MNKNAVALAADSAVTIGNGAKLKIYNTNKLFMLSKYHPVGVMVYGNAELLGVSWETIIKSYREILGIENYAKLVDYGDDFVEFIEKNRTLFPDSQQTSWAHSQIYIGLSKVKATIDAAVKAETDANRQISDAKLTAILRAKISDADRSVQAAESLSLDDAATRRCVRREFADFIEKIISQVFQKLPLSVSLRSKLKRICQNLLFKDLNLGAEAGIVIAGFGKDDFFPSLISYEAAGIVCNRLKYKRRSPLAVDWQNTAYVYPFAQSEMVWTFLQGIEPDLQTQLNGFLSKLFEENYPREILKTVRMRATARSSLETKLKNVGNVLVNELFAQVERYKREKNQDPILEAVEFLPKEELATMAESLVNLTSFKRRVTLDAETVGGPIDVAVISKGDGFIWVKRKHYFDSEINPQFRANYYRA